MSEEAETIEHLRKVREFHFGRIAALMKEIEGLRLDFGTLGDDYLALFQQHKKTEQQLRAAQEDLQPAINGYRQAEQRLAEARALLVRWRNQYEHDKDGPYTALLEATNKFLLP